MSESPHCGRPPLGPAGEVLPCPLLWPTPDVARCAYCELLFHRQPGALVWVHDPVVSRLADALEEARQELTLLRSGVTREEAEALHAAPLPPPPPRDEDEEENP